jgi:hypothetical protein
MLGYYLTSHPVIQRYIGEETRNSYQGPPACTGQAENIQFDFRAIHPLSVGTLNLSMSLHK